MVRWELCTGRVFGKFSRRGIFKEGELFTGKIFAGNMLWVELSSRMLGELFGGISVTRSQRRVIFSRECPKRLSRMGVRIPISVREYKSPCAAVVIWARATKINTHTERDSFWSVMINSAPSELQQNHRYSCISYSSFTRATLSSSATVLYLRKRTELQWS